MKITILLTQSLEDPSGLGRFWPLSKELAKLGHEVTVFALHPDYSNVKPRRFERDNVFVHYVAPMHIWKRGNIKGYYPRWQLPFILLRAIVMLTWYALCTPTEAIQLGKAQPMNGIAGLLASWWHGVPLYVDCDDFESISNRFQGGWQQSIVEWWETLLPQWACGVTVNTQYLKNHLLAQNIPPEKIVYVPNGVDQERFRPPTPQEINHHKEKLKLTNQRVVMYIGSLSLKNHPVDLLIDAFAQVWPTVDNVILVIVGGGEDLPTLQAQVEQLGLQEAVHFVGRVSAEMVPLMISLAEVTIEPIYDDLIAASRSPLKIFESLAMGVPIITGDVGERCQIVADAGLVVSAGQVGEFATAIKQVIDNPTKQTAMHQACRRLRGLYYWERLIQQFVRVYSL